MIMELDTLAEKAHSHWNLKGAKAVVELDYPNVDTFSHQLFTGASFSKKTLEVYASRIVTSCSDDEKYKIAALYDEGVEGKSPYIFGRDIDSWQSLKNALMFGERKAVFLSEMVGYNRDGTLLCGNIVPYASIEQTEDNKYNVTLQKKNQLSIDPQFLINSVIEHGGEFTPLDKEFF